MKVRNVMTESPFYCQQTDTVQHAVELMKLHDVGAIPVVNDNEERQLLGIVTDRDICLRVIGAGKANKPVRVGDVMSKAPATCHTDDSLTSCESVMERYQVRRVPVIDDRGSCVGIVSQADIARMTLANAQPIRSRQSRSDTCIRRDSSNHPEFPSKPELVPL